MSKWLAVVPFPYSLNDTSSFIAEALDSKNIWDIIFEVRFIGLIGLEKELGYWLARSAWGQGIVTEAVRAFVSNCFDRFGFKERHAD